MGETPVPIPNTMVKTQAADGTALETVWESRWPPNLKKKRLGWMKLQKSKFVRAILRILEYQPTDMRKQRMGSLGIDTDKGRQQPAAVNPISRAVLLG